MRAVIFFIGVVLQCIEAYKILLVFPATAKSHSILGNGYARHLLEAGHEVTLMTAYPTDNRHPNLRQIDVSSNINLLPDKIKDIHAMMKKETNVNDMHLVFQFLFDISVQTVEHPHVQALLNDTSQEFDLVIAEWLFSEIYAGFSSVYNCPYIWSSSMEPHSLVLQLIDEPSNPAYVADMQTSSNVNPYTFWQRAGELYHQIKTSILRARHFSARDVQAYEKLFGPQLSARGRTLPPFDIIKYNASLMFGNSHVSLGEALRLPQSYKPIGGYHVDSNVKALPQDIQRIMDNATHGVIYFSLGSNLRSKDMPEEMKMSLIKMFGELNQIIIWKLEENLPNTPSNVHVLSWAPQQSILSHKNCILFITHGGLLSTTETVHFGVPIIGIPVFADQFMNVARAVKKGFAKRVDLSYNIANELNAAIKDILEDSRYKQKVELLSMIYHDRPASPGAELVHWVNHVIRTNGAPHLRSPALQLTWYQKCFLDLFALLSFLASLLFLILRKVSNYVKRSKVDIAHRKEPRSNFSRKTHVKKFL